MLTCEVLDITEALQRNVTPTRVIRPKPGQLFRVVKSPIDVQPGEKIDWAKQVGDVVLVPLLPYRITATNETLFFAAALQLASKIMSTGVPGKAHVFIGHPMQPVGDAYQLWMGLAIQER